MTAEYGQTCAFEYATFKTHNTMMGTVSGIQLHTVIRSKYNYVLFVIREKIRGTLDKIKLLRWYCVIRPTKTEPNYSFPPRRMYFLLFSKRIKYLDFIKK